MKDSRIANANIPNMFDCSVNWNLSLRFSFIGNNAIILYNSPVCAVINIIIKAQNIMYDKRRNRVVFIDVDSWRKFDPTKKRNKRKIKNGLKINMNAYKDSIFLYGGEHESKIR